MVENLEDVRSATMSVVQFFGPRLCQKFRRVMIDLDNGLIRIRNPARKYAKRLVNRIITDEKKHHFIRQKSKITQIGSSSDVATFRYEKFKVIE